DRRPDRRAPRGTASTLLSSIDRAAALLGPGLAVAASNAAWRERFPGTDATGPVAWGDASLSLALRGLLAGGAAVEERVVELNPDGEALRRVRVSATALPAEDGEGVWILLVVKEPETSE